MTLQEVTKEFENLQRDHNNVPNPAQGEKHEKAIVFDFIRAIGAGQTKEIAEVAKFIISHVRFI